MHQLALSLLRQRTQHIRPLVDILCCPVCCLRIKLADFIGRLIPLLPKMNLYVSLTTDVTGFVIKNLFIIFVTKEILLVRILHY